MKEHKSRCCDAHVSISGRHGGRTLRVYCNACHKLQDTYRFALERWSESDLDDLDAKFDALAEHLKIEFVFERISDGSDKGDSERCYVRNKD